MAKIVRAEGGVHYTILRMTGARPTGTFASLKRGRSNPWGVTSRWSPMQLGRPLQTNRSDRDPSPAVRALACADRLEIDLLSQPLGPATLVGSRMSKTKRTPPFREGRLGPAPRCQIPPELRFLLRNGDLATMDKHVKGNLLLDDLPDEHFDTDQDKVAKPAWKKAQPDAMTAVVGAAFDAAVSKEIASIVRHQHMNRKLHKIRRLYGPSLLFKPARCASGDMDPMGRPFSEKEFADENWRDASGAPQARQPKRRHIGAVSGIVGAAFDTATTPAARKRLCKEELAVTIRSQAVLLIFPLRRQAGSRPLEGRVP